MQVTCRLLPESKPFVLCFGYAYLLDTACVTTKQCFQVCLAITALFYSEIHLMSCVFVCNKKGTAVIVLRIAVPIWAHSTCPVTSISSVVLYNRVTSTTISYQQWQMPGRVNWLIAY